MSKIRMLSLVFVLLGVLFVVVAVRPPSAQAALPAGITLTPTAESPTNTAPAPAPTETPGGGILPPAEVTPTPGGLQPTEPPAPAHKEKKPTATAVPILPTTGEIPPDSPFSGPFIFGILAAGILIGLAIGLGLRKFLSSKSWVSLFLSSRR